MPVSWLVSVPVALGRAPPDWSCTVPSTSAFSNCAWSKPARRRPPKHRVILLNLVIRSPSSLRWYRLKVYGYLHWCYRWVSGGAGGVGTSAQCYLGGAGKPGTDGTFSGFLSVTEARTAQPHFRPDGRALLCGRVWRPSCPGAQQNRETFRLSPGLPGLRVYRPLPAPRTLLDQVAAAHRGLLFRILAGTQLRTPILGRLLPRFQGDHPLADIDVFGCVDHVLVPGRQNALDLLLGLADARGIHRVRRKDARHRPGLLPLQRLQLLEDADGAIGIVAGRVQILHAQVVGLRLILAREVHECRRDADIGALAGPRAPNTAPQNLAARDARQVDDLGPGCL